jgi:hypothetical protein
MTYKPISIDPTLHRQIAIHAAMTGESMRSITERAIRRELERMARKDARKLSATSEGTQAGA